MCWARPPRAPPPPSLEESTAGRARGPQDKTGWGRGMGNACPQLPAPLSAHLVVSLPPAWRANLRPLCLQVLLSVTIYLGRWLAESWLSRSTAWGQTRRLKEKTPHRHRQQGGVARGRRGGGDRWMCRANVWWREKADLAWSTHKGILFLTLGSRMSVCLTALSEHRIQFFFF